MTEQGSKLELVIPSNEDFFLTGNPEITFFTCVYRRHTHFSNQLFNIKFDTPVDFGTISEMKIPIMGDLLHKMYVKFEIPEISIDKEDSMKTSIIDIENKIKDINKIKTLYNIFKSLANANMSSYVEILRLEYLANLTIDTLYQIVNNNTATFESQVVIVDGISYPYNIYLSKELRNDRFKDIVIKDVQTNTPYTYGNYQTTLTMTKENIKSLLSKNNKDETKENIISILTDIKKTMERLDQRFIYLINTLTKDYENMTKGKSKFAWVKYLGHNLIDYIEIRIGNDTIDRQYGQWMNIWWELSGNKYQEELYDDIIGNRKELITFDDNVKPSTTIYVPVPFWFCRNIGLSLPLLSLQYSDIMIRMKLREFKDVCYSDFTGSGLNDLNKHLDCSIICECYYLDKMERMKFARSAHEYLIEQTQFNTETFLLNDKNTHQFNFQHPVKGVVWVLQESRNLLLDKNVEKHTDEEGNNDDPFNNMIIPNTTIYENNIITNELMLENDTLENEHNRYFNNVIPYHRFDNSGSEGIYSYWYSMMPFEHQPSGSCNMSFIKNNKLFFTVNDEDISEEHILNCYALNYNILRISNGSGRLAFK